MKLKYKLKIHNFLDCYPTLEDVLFDIITFIQEKDGGNIEKEWTVPGIRRCFHKEFSDEKIMTGINKLIEKNYIKQTDKNKFKIIKNPF